MTSTRIFAIPYKLQELVELLYPNPKFITEAYYLLNNILKDITDNGRNPIVISNANLQTVHREILRHIVKNERAFNKLIRFMKATSEPALALYKINHLLNFVILHDTILKVYEGILHKFNYLSGNIGLTGSEIYSYIHLNKVLFADEVKSNLEFKTEHFYELTINWQFKDYVQLSNMLVDKYYAKESAIIFRKVYESNSPEKTYYEEPLYIQSNELAAYLNDPRKADELYLSEQSKLEITVEYYDEEEVNSWGDFESFSEFSYTMHKIAMERCYYELMDSYQKLLTLDFSSDDRDTTAYYYLHAYPHTPNYIYLGDYNSALFIQRCYMLNPEGIRIDGVAANRVYGYSINTPISTIIENLKANDLESKRNWCTVKDWVVSLQLVFSILLRLSKMEIKSLQRINKFDDVLHTISPDPFYWATINLIAQTQPTTIKKLRQLVKSDKKIVEDITIQVHDIVESMFEQAKLIIHQHNKTTFKQFRQNIKQPTCNEIQDWLTETDKYINDLSLQDIAPIIFILQYNFSQYFHIHNIHERVRVFAEVESFAEELEEQLIRLRELIIVKIYLYLRSLVDNFSIGYK